MQTPQQRYKAMKSQSLKDVKPPSEGELKRRLAESFKKKSESDVNKLDLSKVFPKEVLKMPVFTNKHAVETIQQLIMLEGVEVCEHMPCVCTAMELLLQKTRGIYTRGAKD